MFNQINATLVSLKDLLHNIWPKTFKQYIYLTFVMVDDEI